MREVIWSYEKCKEAALKCKTKMEFKKKYPTAYSKANRNKWHELFSHTIEILKPNGYWTYDRCKELALRCKTKMEFIKHKGDAYGISLKNNWLDDICSHFNAIGNVKKRCIYLYEFKNNVIYIGLTYDFEGRWIKRLRDKKDIVKIYIDQTGENPKRTKLTDYIDVKEASIKEGIILKKYTNNGFIILNRVKTGSIGGNHRIWTYEKCKEEALKYSNYIEFKKNNNNCLASIYKNKWYDLLNHLEYKKRANGYWNKEKCLEYSKKCKGRTDFSKKFRGAYSSSKINNWLDEFFPKINKL